MEVRLCWRDSDRTAVLEVGEGESVLEAAEAAGVGLPFGCRTGACGTCTALLLEGEVSHRRPPRALKERHLADGYVLTCIATPETDVRLEVGAAVQRDLVPNPWR
ncbi:MAG: 2Fe-2S iron-sulfur cluster-binding protein [Haloarculaceae archaeon]